MPFFTPAPGVALRPLVAVNGPTELRPFGPSSEFAPNMLAVYVVGLGPVFFHWDALNTDADDGVSIIKPDDIAPADPGRWVLLGGGGSGESTLTDALLLAGEVVSAGDPVAIDPTTGDLVLAMALPPGGQEHRKEVYGVATVAGVIGAPLPVATAGVASHPGPFVAGDVLFLAPAGGVSTSAPPLDTPGQRIVRIGQARTSTTVQVRIQHVAET